MLTINKDKVAEWMLLSYLAEQNYFKDRIQFFEKKYNLDFEKFEEKMNTSKEKFVEWDDYIDWKAYRKLLANLNKTIEDVRLGKFKLAKS